MIIGKRVLVFALVLLLINISAISFVSGLDVFVSSEEVVGTIINDHNEPAVFKVTINNQGLSNTFELYVFEKFLIEPSEVVVAAGKTETMEIQFFPIGSMKDNIGHVT